MYEKAAELNHRLYGAYYNLGQICFIERDLDTAEKYFEKSLYDEDLEAMSYYQLAKIYVLKGEKEKAITFINKAIEIDKSLLQKATSEKIFEKIKEYITVSVNMEEKEQEEKVLTDEDFMDPVYTKEVGETNARQHLEETTSLVEEINENTAKQRVSEKVTNIINREKLKKLLEEEELQNSKEETEEEKQKNENI
jgi:tetratricopeptide (TPR) repeat protein